MKSLVCLLFGIILIIYSLSNPYPGKLYNRPQGADVYAGVVVDYSGDTVTPKNFLQILQGNATAMSGIGTGKVIDR